MKFKTIVILTICAAITGIYALGGWNEDTALLGAAYTLSLLSTWLCHRVRPRAALGNLIVMFAYNAVLSYNLVFNSHYGAGFTWWFFILLLNTIHSICLLIFILISYKKRKTAESEC